MGRIGVVSLVLGCALVAVVTASSAAPLLVPVVPRVLDNKAIQICFFVVLFLAAIDQFLYIYRKGTIPGPAYVPPFIGKLWASFFPKFEGYISQWNAGDVSCSSVLHKFIVFATSNDNARKVFNTPTEFTPAGVASMRTILLHENWVFLSGKAHLDYRRKLAPLFSRTALAAYIPLLQHAYEENIANWLKESDNGKHPLTMQYRIRDMNMTAALGAFCGRRYLPPGADREMSEAFKVVTFAMQLVNIPLAVPGTAVYEAVQNRIKILQCLASCVEQSRTRLAQPGQLPESLLDRWVVALNKEQEDWEAGGKQGEQPRVFTAHEMAMTVFSFIFASQDASTSSLTWALQVLAEHPDVLAKIREEQLNLRPNNEPMTFGTLEKMSYLWRVVKELLRYRPPVLMMPYEALKNTNLNGHHVAKGTFVVVGIYPSLYDPNVYAAPECFDPDRFSEERAEDKKNPQNYMVWGHGPHACIGREYAMSHLVAFIGYLSTTCNWTHVRTEKSDRIAIIATTYPEDGCIIHLTKRLT